MTQQSSTQLDKSEDKPTFHPVRSWRARLGSLIRPNPIKLNVFLFTVILLLGILARTWEFRSLPPGLNQDEASSGVDAFDLLHYGIDRNGVSFPVLFISWGSGQNALYAYTLIPSIAIGGLSPFTVRLPMLISGILTLPLVYFIGKRVAGNKFGLISMFLLAISPWHIMLSRWGLESNILPFIFTAGFFLILKSMSDHRWFIPAMGCMALCFYAYGTAYGAIPLFLLFALPVLLWAKKISLKKLAPGLLLFVILSAPIGLFLFVNARHWESLHIGLITIPQLPARPRYEAVSILFKGNPIGNLVQKLGGLVNLLWLQVDGNVFNAFDPYGYFYKFTLPLAVLGAGLLVPFRKPEKTPERILLLVWLAVSLIIGILQPVNINRINLVFIPLIFCVAYVLVWLSQRSTPGLLIALSIFLVVFGLFTYAYHGSEYRKMADQNFFPGLLPAIDFASQQGHQAICVTDTVNEPYIFVMFSRHLDPAYYLQNITYTNPHASSGGVQQLGRYTFGLKNCPTDPGEIYILSDETPPGAVTYHSNNFDSFIVYVPGAASK